ncbi:MAG: hypothetical protein JST54_17380 [Deltaproteobacteria bacterium]|nr:hypothetical protein [Deltaproteobacteria bacterium]
MKKQFLVPGSWFLAVALFACTHGAVRPDPAGSVDAGNVDAGVDPSAHAALLAAAIAEERHLALQKPVPVVVDSTDVFREAFRKKSARESKLSGADREDLEPEWVAFGFVAPAGSAPDAGVAADQVAEVASGVLDEQIAGYYDEFEHRMHLPAEMPTSVTGGVDPSLKGPVQEFLVAHELEHALQDQHFGFERLTRLPAATEARLCTNAVYEGDAMLAGLVHLANQLGVQPGRMLEATDRQLSKGRLQGSGKQLESAPPVLRERLLFPYAAGLHLAIALYRTGGWPLVDALFAHPPQTEAQLLHPEKYVAGVGAVPVAVPSVPQGQRAVASGSLGELGTMTVLLESGHAEVARRGANGWAGDAFLISAPDGSKRLTLQWVTTWDSEEDAERFLGLVNRVVRGGWTDGPEHPKSWTIRGPASAVRAGKTVIVVRDMAGAELTRRTPELMTLVGPKPPDAPPLGKLTLAGPTVTGQVLPDGAYGSEPWALYVPTPPGFIAIAEPQQAPGILLMVARGKPFAAGSFGVLSRPFSLALAQQTFDMAEHREKNPKRVGEGSVTLAGARGWQRTLVVDDRRVQTLVVPACGGAQAFVFQLSFEQPADEPLLRDWLESFANKADAPACPR